MRTKQEHPPAKPGLEPLHARLVPSTTLVPHAGDPEQFTLRIDLRQHLLGGDGLPDTLLISRAGGRIEVTLVGRVPELLFDGASAAVADIEVIGSDDVEYVLLGDTFAPPVTLIGSDDDHLVQLGQPILVPEFPDDDPEIYYTTAIETDDPPGYVAQPLLAADTHNRFDTSSDHLFSGYLFELKTTAPLGRFVTTSQTEPEERILVPPELLEGKLVREPFDVRKLQGGGHQEPSESSGGRAEMDMPMREDEEEIPQIDPEG